jgi:simple sugar transport system ATP-binding protein
MGAAISGASASQVPLVQMEGVVKRFPGVVANDGIAFELRQGEIHALLGENGAGKTTLMNVLYGLYRADTGRIRVGGQTVQIRAPRDAIALGIGMVHQNLKLVSTHTVGENVLLGLSEPKFALDLDGAGRRIADIARRYGLHVDPSARIWQLSMGERQRVEIIKILYRESRILILDEPTSLLAPGEIGDLFLALRRMADERRGVVLITHKLGEVMRISDRVTVLRKGRVVATKSTTSTNEAELASMMVGRPVLFETAREQTEVGRPVLQVEELYAFGYKGLLALKGVSFHVNSGEIFGVAGVAGNGQHELAEVLTGLTRSSGGHVRIDGRDYTNRSAREILDAGVAYVPEDRVGTASVPALSVADNLVLRSYRNSPFSRGPWMNRQAIAESARALIGQYAIMTPDESNPARNLSGGNLQKLILARELSRRPKLLMAEHPTRGLDVGATEYVRRSLLEASRNGTAVVLISEDLEEILAICDRVGIMFEGRMGGIVPRGAYDMEMIGLMMAGARPVTKGAA